MSGRLVAVRAVIWSLFSLIWIGLIAKRIVGLRAAGLAVDWKSWAVLAFWIAVLVFWGVIGARSWLAGRARREFEVGRR